VPPEVADDRLRLRGDQISELRIYFRMALLMTPLTG